MTPTRPSGTTVPPDQLALDVRQAIEAAVWAPSVHNTQPWTFALHGSRVSLRADPDRRLAAADPDGREMLISCGAALFTLRIALRGLGYAPKIRLLPDPDRPHLLADVLPGEPSADREEPDHLVAHVRHRHTHRGGFRPTQVRAALLSTLRWDAEAEGARLIQAVEPHTKGALAALTQVAEHVQRLDPACAAEAARWAPAPGNTRQEGVHHEAYPRQEPHTEPYFPGRDFARGFGWGVPPEAACPEEEGARQPVTGVVLMIVTAGDAPADWLRAGQALQRVLLRAAGDGLAAAFHTQALEVPELRAFIRSRFCHGLHPQILMRLGEPVGPELVTVRRSVTAVIVDEP
ncbi:hypothetical protein ABZ801_20735 [Actinomadura sp. NPDC047616]|uniref:Acg family FMN-binding oxidoreductase n=1 Tax=Actinomadura sp. NPDC047616 TaxID=3155914 RepID=UPI0033ED4F43